jgi:glycosyltransferase involved in cell wall biosynthesis
MTRILYLAPVQWNSVRQRPQQLALRLARHFDVRYVDPVGLRSFRMRDLSRLWHSVKPATRSARPVPVITPRYLPVLGRRLIDQINRRWLFRQLSRKFDLNNNDWILWLSTPSLLAETLLEQTAPRLVVYDCMDRYAAFHRGATRERIERAEAALLRRADVVFASSRSLAERLDRLHEVILVPNGVGTDAFAVRRQRPPEWKQNVAGPVIGFYGTLGDWVDFDLLFELARRRPDWSFVFAGPLACREFDRVRALANVRYLGIVQYDDLPHHAAWFDVGLVPFRLNALTRYVHPIKALEYLALGLPVVSTPLPDLAEHADVVRFAQTSEEWLGAIDRELSADARSELAVQARRQAVAAHDWNSRVASITARLLERIRPAADMTPSTTASIVASSRLQIANCKLQIANY